jgi:hypothetical protein
VHYFPVIFSGPILNPLSLNQKALSIYSCCYDQTPRYVFMARRLIVIGDDVTYHCCQIFFCMKQNTTKYNSALYITRFLIPCTCYSVVTFTYTALYFKIKWTYIETNVIKLYRVAFGIEYIYIYIYCFLFLFSGAKAPSP